MTPHLQIEDVSVTYGAVRALNRLGAVDIMESYLTYLLICRN